tara:strand:+ start:874 stop:1317 length:444 start_codon:yes stop_codon:yes gene_type:complete
MAHVRQQIRDAVASRLTSQVSLVSSRVFTTRMHPLNEDLLPAISVYTGNETSERYTSGVTDINRELSLEIDLYVREASTFDDKCDAIAVQVEEAMAGDFTIGGLAKSSVLTSTEIQFDGEADQILGVAKLTYLVKYVTALNDVETAK